MKKTTATFFLSLAFIFIGTAIQAQSGKKDKTKIVQGHPKLIFKSTAYDFGKVPLGSEVMAVYEVQNTGDVPVIMERVIVPSGFSVWTYPVKPLFPGQGGVIKIKVDTKRAGNKTATFSAVCTDKGTPHKLTLKGQVKPKGAK